MGSRGGISLVKRAGQGAVSKRHQVILIVSLTLITCLVRLASRNHPTSISMLLRCWVYLRQNLVLCPPLRGSGHHLWARIGYASGGRCNLTSCGNVCYQTFGCGVRSRLRSLISVPTQNQ